MGSSDKRLRIRFWLEVGLASITAILAAVTLVWHDWIEAFGFDPDHHNGAAEWLTVVGLCVISLALATTARIEWRRTAIAR